MTTTGENIGGLDDDPQIPQSNPGKKKEGNPFGSPNRNCEKL
jgi:hypothetical protein